MNIVILYTDSRDANGSGILVFVGFPWFPIFIIISMWLMIAQLMTDQPGTNELQGRYETSLANVWSLALLLMIII